MTTLHPFTRTCLAVAVSLLAGTALAQSPSDMLDELRQLRAEMRQMRQELDALRQASIGRGAAGHGVREPEAAASTTSSTVAATSETSETRVNLFGYGELSYARPRQQAADAVATARRGVLGFGYRFNERTRFAAELEIENAVVSSGDRGEAAFEQLYVEHDITDRLTAKAGLFLLPIGYMNETHEPTRYYGVTRNLVETAIIPTTWREMGIGVQSTSEMGLRWNAGLVTSFDLTKWPTDSAETRESPLGAIHQEGQLAKAGSWAYYGALNYDGIPGFNVGGSVFSGGVAQKQPIASPNASVSLAELHAKWQVGRWDLAGLVAQGKFHQVSAFNATALTAGSNGINAVPDQFRGWYAQAAYRLWRQGDYSLHPFARYERVNTALGFSGLPSGLGVPSDPDTRVMTWGASFYLHPQVVLKLDAQRYFNNSSLDRINLGVGFHY